MIISHKHKFIFFKSKKTAGSSIQVTLAKHCGEDDIITGQYQDGIDDETHSTGLNMDKFFTKHPHPPLRETHSWFIDKFGWDTWLSYFKFGFVRNPYDIAVSRYHWNKRGKDTSVEDFMEWTKGDMDMTDKPYIYLGDGVNTLDFIGKYETLQEDYEYICNKLNLPAIPLSNKKSGFRKKKHYSTFYQDENTIERVTNFFREDLQYHGYTFNARFDIKKLHPIVEPQMLKNNDGNNINGPSLIRVPDWVENPLGKYYLYFGHHNGQYIRLAYSDNVEGPYKVHHPGTLKKNQTNCISHIASPDVHIDEESKRIIMYYHGDIEGGQKSFISWSNDGINFETNNKVLGDFYFRVFKHKDKFYSIAKNKNIDGIVYESDSWEGEFKPMFNLLPNIRHTACLVKENILFLFYTTIGDTPESIKVLELDLDTWEPKRVEVLIKPTEEWEGGNLPLTKSKPGSSTVYGGGAVKELRDPCVYEDYLLYSLKGELGIGISKLRFIR